MPVVNVYSIFDTKARAYMQPWYATNHDVAFRNCRASMTQPQSPMAQFPVDFNLFCLGQFDELTGEFHQNGEHMNLGNFSQFVPEENTPPLPLATTNGQA